jgi:CO/xanthine dehydrogenase Mo-binding subunit
LRLTVLLLLFLLLLLFMAGIIVAEDEVTAKHAAHLVEVEYEDLEPIFSIEDAVAKQSFFPREKKVRHVLPRLH